MTVRASTFIISFLLLLLATGTHAQSLHQNDTYIINTATSDTIRFDQLKSKAPKVNLPAERDALWLSRVETVTIYDARGTIVNKRQTDLIGFDGFAPGTYHVVIGERKGRRLVVEVN